MSNPIAIEILRRKSQAIKGISSSQSLPITSSTTTNRKASLFSCSNLGQATGELVECESCGGGSKQKLFSCMVYGECTVDKRSTGIACCKGTIRNGQLVPCPKYEVKQPTPSPSVPSTQNGAHTTIVSSSQRGVPSQREETSAYPPHKYLNKAPRLKWMYGVTTVFSRRNTILPKTLLSLAQAGFDTPRLFVDGSDDLQGYKKQFGLPVTCHDELIKTAGNWVLGLYELYYREPTADRYAIFQDDISLYLNLREYLEALPYPDRGYINLCTYPDNEPLCGKGIGLYLSNQCGFGAQGLVFNRDAVITLIKSDKLAWRPTTAGPRRWKAIDGGIVDAMKKSSYKEYVHNPSLILHIGKHSTMGNAPQPVAGSFLGESYNALDLLVRNP